MSEDDEIDQVEPAALNESNDNSRAYKTEKFV